jgi:radical SAM superfamily enzyme YgiQ (UPF0313 family)
VKFLLIETQYHSSMPNLGLGYLSACLNKEGHEVKLWLNNNKLHDRFSFAALMQRERFDVIGFQMMSSAINKVNEKIALIGDSINDKAKIILGGAHVSGDPHNIFDLIPEADYGFHGEAEAGIVEFARKITNVAIFHAEINKIPNLIYRNGSGTTVNPCEFIKNLDGIPFPAWELMPPEKFPIIPFNGYSRRYPIAPMILTRGCPNECTFCAASVVNGHNIRSRSTENVLEEIKLLIEKFRVKEIQFFDSNCAHQHGPLRDVCRRIISDNIDVTWCAPNGIRVDSIDEELAALMKRSGCFQVNIGIESASPRILKNIRKAISPAMVREKIVLLRKNGIEVVGFFMIGFPGETDSEIKQTISFARQLPLTAASFSILSPLPGTEIYKQLCKNKKMKKEDLGLLDFINYHNQLSEVSYDKLRKIQKEAYLHFYLRPRILKYLLKNLNSFSKISFLMHRAYLDSFKS